MTDRRPDPKPRKNPQLWQAYLWWNELIEMRKRHVLRLSSIEAGKSNLDPMLEKEIIEWINFKHPKYGKPIIDKAREEMINFGGNVGPVWDWLTSIKGLAEGGLAAMLLARIDDISKFDNVSKLWRFSGYGVVNGKAEKNQKGEKARGNKRLKAIVYLIGLSFIRQQTPLYVDIYYQAKAKDREIHPEKIVLNGKSIYSDGHIHSRAMRKMVKIFLQHLWVMWRESEGLETNQPYVQAILNHDGIIEHDKITVV